MQNFNPTIFPSNEAFPAATGKKRLYDTVINEENNAKRMRMSQTSPQDLGQTRPITLEDFQMENLLLRQRCQRLEKIVRVAPIFIRDFKTRVAQVKENSLARSKLWLYYYPFFLNSSTHIGKFFLNETLQGLEVYKNKSQELQRTVERQHQELEKCKSIIKALHQRSIALRKDDSMKKQHDDSSKGNQEQEPQLFQDPEGDAKDKPQLLESTALQLEVDKN